MPPLAIIYDVHGNLPALEAVLADARDAGAQRFLLGGDYALFGPFPAETLPLLHALDDAPGSAATSTAGPPSRTGWATSDDLLPRAVADTREAIGEQAGRRARRARPSSHRARRDPLLPRLPRSPTCARSCPSPATTTSRCWPAPASGGSCSATPTSSSAAPGRAASSCSIPGSVGLPFDGDARAAYALAHDDGSIEHRRVAYDQRRGDRRAPAAFRRRRRGRSARSPDSERAP